MMSKKTQITLFFLIGLVILIAISFVSYVSSNKAKAEIKRESEIINIAEMPSSLLPVKLNLDFCVTEIAKQAVIYTGLYGGYYHVPEPKLAYFFDDVPYYVYQLKDTMPSRSTVEAQISSYVMEQLPECVNGLQDFQGAKIVGKINFVKSVIGKDSVLININYPITISEENTRTQVSDFRAEVPVRLDAIYEIASTIADDKIKNNGALCVDCLIDLADENQVFIDIVSHEDAMVFTIFDNVTKIDNEDYIFSFAMEK